MKAGLGIVLALGLAGLPFAEGRGADPAGKAPKPGAKAFSLFAGVPSPAGPKPPARPALPAVRHRSVRVELASLDEREFLLLNLFKNDSFVARRERIERRAEDRYTWFGTIESVEHGRVILVVEGEHLAGSVSLPGRRYEIRPTAAPGIHRVMEVDEAAFAECDGAVSPALPEAPEAEEWDSSAPSAPSPPSPLPTAPPPPEDDGSLVDVMVVYTPAAKSASANIDADIQLGMALANGAYENSLVNQRVRLVHAAEVPYVESGNRWTDLQRLQDPSDGFMDEVHVWRDEYCADVVSLWVEVINGCGLAYVMSNVSSTFEAWAFHDVRRICATGGYTFVHEMGHNMGAQHDRDNAAFQGAYPYSYGYQEPGGTWRTLMSYNCPGGVPEFCTFRILW